MWAVSGISLFIFYKVVGERASSPWIKYSTKYKKKKEGHKIKDDLNKWKDIYVYESEYLILWKQWYSPNFIYAFIVIPIKIPAAFFVELYKLLPKYRNPGYPE